jgi:hypothetical protein
VLITYLGKPRHIKNNKMYKATPITKRAGSPLHNDLVDNDARNREKGKDTQAYKKISESLSPGTPGEKGKEITKKVNTDNYDGSGGYASDEEWNKFLATDAGKKYTEKNTKEVGTGKFEKDKPGTPDKKNYQATEIMEATTQTVLGDVETRELGRTVKKTGKDARRAGIKEARIKNKQAKFNKRNDGKEIEAGQKGYRKQERLKAKATETEGEKEAFDAAFENAKANRKSGKGIGERIAGEDRSKTQGQSTPDEQIANERLQQDMDASNAKEVARNSASVNFNTDVEQYKPAGMQNVKLKDYSKSFGAKNPVAMMKSPMKKNYFKK